MFARNFRKISRRYSSSSVSAMWLAFRIVVFQGNSHRNLTMGGASSFARRNDPFHTTFVNDNLIEAESKLCSDASLRASFIEFIKNGFWEDKLVVLDDEERNLKSDNVWKAFDYACPPKYSMKSSSSVKSLSTLMGDSTRSSSFENSGKQPHASESISAWSLFTSVADVRAIMLVALIPLFYNSNEYQHWCSPSFCSTSGSTKQDFCAYGGPKTMRLRELFYCAATSCGSAELDLYLAQSTPHLLADFKKAIANIPMRINICKLEGTDVDTPVLFRTSGKAPSILSLPSSPSGSGSMGFDELSPQKPLCGKFCGAEHSPDQREQVAAALAGQSCVKLAVRTGQDRCSLQAIQPVCDAEGNLRCVMSVEAVDKVVVSQVSNPHYNPVAFQQVEDLLLLLPLLIKTD
jgi:hypothetical protein